MSEARRHPPGTLRLGTVAGAEVLLAPSWFLVAAILSLLVAPAVEQAQPGLGALRYVAALAFVVLLYGAVLVHEAAHAVMARRLGMPVGSITLHFLGGATLVEGESRRPRDEFLIAVVGPIASILVGGVALLGALALDEGVLELAFELLAGSNLVIGVLNLVPGLPLDGGRVLAAVVWGATGRRTRGLVVAAWGGRLAAVAVLVFAAWRLSVSASGLDTFDLLFYGLVAWFLWAGASRALEHVRVRELLPELVARALVRPAVLVPQTVSTGEAVTAAREAGAGGIVTTDHEGRPAGVVVEAALGALPDERRPWVPVSDVARPLADGLVLPAAIAGEELVLAISRVPAGEYVLVEDDGSVLGVLATADVDRAYREAAAR